MSIPTGEPGVGDWGGGGLEVTHVRSPWLDLGSMTSRRACRDHILLVHERLFSWITYYWCMGVYFTKISRECVRVRDEACGFGVFTTEHGTTGL